MKNINRNDNLHTPRTRDSALHRLRRVNRWLIAGSAVLTGVLTDVAANAFPGHTIKRTSAGGARAHTHVKHRPLAAPAQAPKAVPTTPAAPPAATEQAPARTETQPPAQEPTPAPSREPAPAEEAPKAEPTPKAEPAAPPPEERPEPVVSGAS